MIHDKQREKDVQTLCRQVLSARVDVYYNPNGPDDSTCPFCREETSGAEYDISLINHKPDCAFFIAKDLTTNIT